MTSILIADSKSPIKSLGTRSFDDFFSAAFYKASHIDVVTGYVSEESLADLNFMLNRHLGLESFSMVVGMARFDGLTIAQKKALAETSAILERRDLGDLMVPTAIPVHAKMTLFRGGLDSPSALVGSSNLSGLSKGLRQWNAEIASDDKALTSDVQRAIWEIKKYSRDFGLVATEIPVIDNSKRLLSGRSDVEPTSPGLIASCDKIFDLELKCSAKSNMNVFFGKGRSGGRLPRPWYEIEVIVGSSITSLPGYPKKEDGSFRVRTDDGWKFDCRVSGDYNKNFRSANDLEVLGKWIKGRLEAKDCITPGERITPDALNAYGRNSISLGYDSTNGEWVLDFSTTKA
ncbi:MAG: NgoFVII family restriction endonuclease [Aquiluna sp.]|nr:NgoFVII family restriction endonuclease [Aquiluna sp.]